MIRVNKSKAEGTVIVPASKSQTIRALLIATFADGESTIINPLISSDTQACIEVCKKFGAKIEILEDKIVVRKGKIPVKDIKVDCQNSGTTMYLSMALACSLNVKVTYYGDKQLSKRPVRPLLQALSDLGAIVDLVDNEIPNYPPFSIKGPLKGGEVSIECPTSQYLSSLMLGCPLSTGSSLIKVPLLYEKPYAEITRWWLRKQKIDMIIKRNFSQLSIPGNQEFKAFNEKIHGDFSSASFFFCMAAITAGSVTVKNLRQADPQGDKQILSILSHMGCSVNWQGDNVTLKGPDKLKAGMFDLNSCPDTFPVLCAVAVFAEGTTVLFNVPQARIKETDRISVMRENLEKLSIWTRETEDGIVIEGSLPLKHAKVKGHKDHRIIMALATIGLGSDEGLSIDDEKAIAVTFPNFIEVANSITNNAIEKL